MDGGPAQPVVATVAMLASLPVGIAVALCCWRAGASGASRSLNGIVHLPLILPPVVTGYLLLIGFGRRGPIGAVPRRPVRHRVLLPLDRRGAGLRA